MVVANFMVHNEIKTKPVHFMRSRSFSMAISHGNFPSFSPAGRRGTSLVSFSTSRDPSWNPILGISPPGSEWQHCELVPGRWQPLETPPRSSGLRLECDASPVTGKVTEWSSYVQWHPKFTCIPGDLSLKDRGGL